MKSLAIFLAGAAAGALATYLYFYNKIDKLVEETVKEEMERFLIRQEQMMSSHIYGEVEEEKEEVEEEIVSDTPDTTEKTSIVELETTTRTKYRDNDGIEEDEDDEEYITDEDMSQLIEISQQRMSEKPRIISEEERDLCGGYDWIEFTWYPENNILVDVYGQTVEDVEAIIGPIDWRNALKDVAEITIRDFHDATDYTFYNDDIHGKE